MKHMIRKGQCNIEFACKVGFFGRMAWCLRIFHYCQKSGIVPHIRFTTPLDSTATDLFAPFFYKKKLSLHETNLGFIKLHSLKNIFLPFQDISLDEARILTGTYLGITPEISMEVSDFADANFGKNMLHMIHVAGLFTLASGRTV